ncbi:MAG TPA: DUF5683 domain-containing protein [Bacteroidia bacterium]|nr:DUF5683 domain-containing protein [Bacteroidia bacterium]
MLKQLYLTSCFLFLLSTSGKVFSQQPVADSVTKVHSPSRAVLYSAILPGAGQAYNKKYWKIPIIYAGIGVLVYAIDFNQNNYSTFKDAYIIRTDGDSTTTDEYPRYTDDNLKTLFEYYRRNRDLSYILISTLYVLNILDAYVDAELFYFDVSDKLSLRTTPFMMHSLQGDKIGGLSFKLIF